MRLQPAPPTHCRRTSLISTLVTSRYTMAALPTAKLAHEDRRCVASRAAGGGIILRNCPSEGGKVLRNPHPNGGVSFENRHRRSQVRMRTFEVTTNGTRKYALAERSSRQPG